MGKVHFYFVPEDVDPGQPTKLSQFNRAEAPSWITGNVEQWVLKLDYSAF